MKNYKMTTITNESTNGVFHNVTIGLDGTVEAIKIIDGKAVQIYNWSYKSKEEVYETAKQSGHQEYLIREEIVVPEKLKQQVSSSQIRKIIKEAKRQLFSDEEYTIQFDIESVENNLDVSMTIWNENMEMISDTLIATTISDTYENTIIAESMQRRLEAKFQR